MVESIDIPGHFTINKPFYVGFINDNGVATPHHNPEIHLSAPIAGDVNKDDVIDLKDALEIQANWGTNTRSSDINFDGTVDALDFAFFETNYLMQNPTVVDAPKAVKVYKDKSIEDVKRELGIN
jgi:Dockerin type I domain